MLGRNSDAVVVLVDDDDAAAAAASRLARMHAHGRRPNVFVRTIWRDLSVAARDGVPVRFSPALVRVRPVQPETGSDLVQVESGPGDMATRAAELHHAVYCSWLPVAGSETTSQPPSNTSRNLTAQPWNALPGFYQEDNVRQLWHVLAFFTVQGFTWVRVTGQDSPDPELLKAWEPLVQMAAESEHKRWARLRRRYGWWPADPVTDAKARVQPYKHDGHRMH